MLRYSVPELKFLTREAIWRAQTRAKWAIRISQTNRRSASLWRVRASDRAYSPAAANASSSRNSTADKARSGGSGGIWKIARNQHRNFR